jgi:hypothetical protein
MVSKGNLLISCRYISTSESLLAVNRSSHAGMPEIVPHHYNGQPGLPQFYFQLWLAGAFQKSWQMPGGRF